MRVGEVPTVVASVRFRDVGPSTQDDTGTQFWNAGAPGRNGCR